MRPHESRDYDFGVEPVPGQHFHLLEQSRPNLGRHVLHDDRSLAYDAADREDVRAVTKIVTTRHSRTVPPFDQGQIGSCTANAALGLMMSEPFHKVGWNFTETDVVEFYKRETVLDNRQIPGSYPAEDTGSTGLWSMKTLKALDLIEGYQHAFSFATLEKLLQLRPVSMGVPWFNSMFTPDTHGTIRVDQSSGLAGGHQIEVTGIDVENQMIEFANSWGTSWGLLGYGRIPFVGVHSLLALHGDVSVPIA